jgi:hypothetical protein
MKLMFCARLKNYLTYYCHSRAIDGSFDDFFSLCVADKLKSTLSEACLDHVLTAEGNTWQKCDDLADTIDTYLANHTHDGRTKTSSSANASKQHFNASDVNSSRKWNVNNSRSGNGNASVNSRGGSNASFMNRTQKLKTRSLLAVRILPPSKTRDCATFANRRVIGSLIVLYVVDRRLAKVSRVQVHGRQHHATLHVPLIAL